MAGVPVWRSCRSVRPTGATSYLITRQKGRRMNWDQIEGKWKEVKGQAKQKWGDLTNDDLDQIDGRRDQLVGKIQARYGIAKEDAEAQVKEFESSISG